MVAKNYIQSAFYMCVTFGVMWDCRANTILSQGACPEASGQAWLSWRRVADVLGLFLFCPLRFLEWVWQGIWQQLNFKTLYPLVPKEMQHSKQCAQPEAPPSPATPDSVPGSHPPCGFIWIKPWCISMPRSSHRYGLLYYLNLYTWIVALILSVS
jgi:hypothetical protein